MKDIAITSLRASRTVATIHCAFNDDRYMTRTQSIDGWLLDRGMLAMNSISRLFGMTILAVSALVPNIVHAQVSEPMMSAEPQRYEQAYVTANVNVRNGPNARERVVNRLRRGDFVNVSECRGNWCYVDVRGGNGWVSGQFIGRGENPYHSRGPAGPGIPPQEPGTVY